MSCTCLQSWQKPTRSGNDGSPPAASSLSSRNLLASVVSPRSRKSSTSVPWQTRQVVGGVLMASRLLDRFVARESVERDDELRTLRLVIDAQLGQLGQLGADGGLSLGGHHEHQEAATPGAAHLAARRAGALGALVPVVDLAVAHAAGQPALEAPALVHEPAEGLHREVAVGDQVPEVVGLVAQALQVGEAVGGVV